MRPWYMLLPALLGGAGLCIAFTHRPLHTIPRLLRLECSSSADDKDLTSSMQAARDNAARDSSPGAGLDAFEAADAAYADLINTSIDQRNITLTAEQIKDLERGGSMWESGAKTQTQTGGVLGDLANALGALFGGAQIVKNKFGET